MELTSLQRPQRHNVVSSVYSGCGRSWGGASAMRSFQLNGWQRIGIVLSMLWAVVGGLWGNHIAIKEGSAIPTAHYKWCISQPDYDDDEYSATFDEEYAVGVRGHWAFAAMAGLVPIPVAWLLVYILVWTVRCLRHVHPKFRRDVQGQPESTKHFPISTSL